ncbi:chloride channel protein [Beijerinckia indica]|nr:chloride channel protein [Beijerinckia indica]
MPAPAPIFSEKVLRIDVPAILRGIVRRHELGLILLGLITGQIAGIFVAGIFFLAGQMHKLLFGIALESHLSSLSVLSHPLQALVPVVGGLVVGVTGHFIQTWRNDRPIDPIEANALRGGTMSLLDSLLITGQTILSNGSGASVGLEASYTQLGSGFASWLGQAFRLRRADLRTLVACGSAGAIAAAFEAPLTGSFYAFELILGSYTPFGLAPIGAAAVGGALTARALGTGGDFIGHIPAVALSNSDMALLLLLGMICGLFGIGVMRAVTTAEALFRNSRIPIILRPAVGGVVLGAFALITPHVLASGHGALSDLFDEEAPAIGFLFGVLLLKATASAISIGSGFRGGLFFASLYLGGILGRIFVGVTAWANPTLAPDAWLATIVGMAAMAVAIIGGPMTMTFLALETTGDLPLSIEMLAVAAIVSVMVRRMFGYSFATWRLHLRGESIRSAQDIGWMRDLTVGKLMRSDTAIVRSDLPLARFKREFPLGSAQWVIAADTQGHYAGMVAVTDAWLTEFQNNPVQEDFGREKGGKSDTGAPKDATITPLLRQKMCVLLPEMNVKMAAQMFERSESEALAVVADVKDWRIIGLLTESQVLRRYTQELDKARRDLSGETWSGEG